MPLERRPDLLQAHAFFICSLHYLLKAIKPITKLEPCLLFLRRSLSLCCVERLHRTQLTTPLIMIPSSRTSCRTACTWHTVAVYVIVCCLQFASADGTFQCINAKPCGLACNATLLDNASAHQTATGVQRLRNRHPNAAAATTSESHSVILRPHNSAMSMINVIRRVVNVAEHKLAAAIQKLAPNQYPTATLADSGEWMFNQAGHWTSGFFPGVLWQLHALTGKQQWADAAQKWQEGLANQQRSWKSQHDYGFIYLPTFAHSYSVTKSPGDLHQALGAAEALAWNWNPATKSLRTFEGWEPQQASKTYKQIVIIDFMINLQMLVWGAQHVGHMSNYQNFMDRNPEKDWLHMALEHARQVATNHIRADGSTYHIVEYHPDSGAVIAKYQYQGYKDNTTWARGQSWAVAGFAMLYNQTGLDEFKQVAMKVTDRWLQLLMEQDGPAKGSYVPIWDFNAPYNTANDGPRDTSSAAIAALGMLHLAEAMPNTECGQKYLCAAVNTMRALASPKFLSTPDEPYAALLKHATGNLPDNDKIDVGLVYADYYYLMALKKCHDWEACRNYSL